MNHSAHLVKWVIENNRPIFIVGDRELHELLTAGRPNIEIPSSNTISCDIKVSFDKCREHVAMLLQVRHCRQFDILCLWLIYIIGQKHPGCLHFTTEA